MNEWGVFIAISELFIFIVAVIKPIMNLNTTIVRLNDAIDRLDEKLDDLVTKNEKSHERIWRIIDDLEDSRNDHEIRLVKLESVEEEK